MKLKKIAAAAFASLLLLSACGSTPVEEPAPPETASTETVENLQTETKPEEKPDVEEMIELYIPCYYNYVVPLLPDNTFAALEDYGASNFKKMPMLLQTVQSQNLELINTLRIPYPITTNLFRRRKTTLSRN